MHQLPEQPHRGKRRGRGRDRANSTYAFNPLTILPLITWLHADDHHSQQIYISASCRRPYVIPGKANPTAFVDFMDSNYLSDLQKIISRAGETLPLEDQWRLLFERPRKSVGFMRKWHSRKISESGPCSSFGVIQQNGVCFGMPNGPVTFLARASEDRLRKYLLMNRGIAAACCLCKTRHFDILTHDFLRVSVSDPRPSRHGDVEHLAVEHMRNFHGRVRKYANHFISGASST